MLGVGRGYEVGLVNTQEQRAGSGRLRSRLPASTMPVVLTLELPTCFPPQLSSGQVGWVGRRG